MYWLLAVGVLGMVLLWQYFRDRNSYFKRLGVDGPEPSLALGNSVDLIGKVPALVIKEWGRRFGPTFGYMEGGRPVLVTADPDLLQEVFVKQFSNFHSRKEFPLAPNPDTDKRVHVFGARGARWKRLRTISTPVFTASKMRQMQPFLHGSIEELTSILDKEAEKGQTFDIYPYFQRLTLDVIAKVAFGYETSVQSGENAEFYQLVKSFFGKNTFFGNIFSTLSIIFPEAKSLWRMGARFRSLFFPIPFVVLNQRLGRAVARRKADGPGSRKDKLKDFIDMMLELEAAPGSFEEAGGKGGEVFKVSKALTTDEVVAQMLVILIAGYETTSTALAFLFFQLAQHQDVQEELFQELKEHIGEEDKVDHDSVTKLPLLDRCVSEGLRLYPHGAMVVTRKCMATTEAAGMTVPQGLNVAADVWNLHHNPELWGDDAEKFRPSRFEEGESAGRHPMAYMPFGGGPRICLGMRFALLEEKLAVARLILRYKVVPGPETPAELTLQGTVTTGPATVPLRLVRRH